MVVVEVPDTLSRQTAAGDIDPVLPNQGGHEGQARRHQLNPDAVY